MKSKITIFFLLFITFININNASAKLFNANEFYLDNGLRVIVIPNNKAPIIKQMLWYKTGSIDERTNKGGLAHLTEHLMFRGTKDIPNNKFNEIISQYGGISNAFTSQDFTSYHQFIDISKLELVMHMEADRMENLNFSKDAFKKEKSIVLQERLQNTDNDPNQIFLERLDHIFWQDHEYKKPVIGSITDIKNLKYNDVIEFYNSHYSPNNAILVLSGDIDIKTAKTLTEKHYGKIKEKQKLNNKKFEKIDNNIKTIIETENKKITTAKIIKKYLSNSYNTNKENIYKTIVLNKIIADGETSLLNKKFVLEDKSSIAVGSSYNPYKRDLSSINIYLIPKNNNDTERLNNELNDFLKNIDKIITEEDFKKTKNKILANLIYIKDNPETSAYQIGIMASTGMTLEEIENWDKSIDNVEYNDILQLAKTIFNEKTNITGIITPKAK